MKKYSLLLLILYCCLTPQVMAESNQIEIFDVTKSEVIKTLPLDESKKNEAIKLLKSVESLFPKLNPTPINGIMIKVPLEPEIKVDNELITDPVIEVIFIFPENERPYMLTFNDKKDHLMFYYFSEDSSRFLKQLGLTS